MSKKVVLGFSGGLDTSFCVKYLTDEKGYEVHSITVNTGGFAPDELKSIEEHAYNLGVKSHASIDAVKTYYDRIIRFLIFGNVLKNNTYPLSVSAERLSQALHIATHTKELNADAVAHGSTGAGNDQVRFDMIFHIMIPGAEIITPIRDLQLSREEEIKYLKTKKVNLDFSKAQYSINKGLWGTSVGGKETLVSKGMLPEEAWPTQVTKTGSEEVKLTFEKGELKKVNDKIFTHPSEAIQHIQSLAGPYGIGRDIHVGDTIIGIKGRVGFEAAAPMVIIKAHHALEKNVLTKWQLAWKDQLSQFYGNWLHEGQILDPVMRDIEAYLESSQHQVTGDVFVQLLPYRFQITGIESRYDLMSSKFGKYGEMNAGWSGNDVRGFSKIFGNQTMIYHSVKNLLMKKVEVGIVGGAGYTGGELIRLLLHHPEVNIVYVNSRSNAGKEISSIHNDLIGETDLLFSRELTDDIDVLFLCVGHGEARTFLAEENNINEEIKIIDLSQDFRLHQQSQIGNRKFIYGLPELNRQQIKSANNIANPGCFATAIQLGLLPLAKAGILKEVYTTGITGSTGAGQGLSPTSHFSWRANNIQAYKTLTHQHLNEITESLEHLQRSFQVSSSQDSGINFIPWRGDFTRGIFISSLLSCDLSEVTLRSLYEDFYEDATFTYLSNDPISLKQVVNTNKCVLQLEKVGNKLVVHSAIDNLLKGASGQAVQNMNLMFGIDEMAGLKLKASGF